MQKNSKYKNFKNIVNIFYNEELQGIEETEDKIRTPGTIKIEPKIFYDKFSKDMKVEFKIGNKKMYKIKDLSLFYTMMMNKEFYRYGEKLKFTHTLDAFEDESKPLLDFIMKYAEIIKYANSNSNSNFKYYGKALSDTSIIIGNSAMDDLFESLKGRKIAFQKDYNISEIEFAEENPDIEFELKKIDDNNYIIEPNVDIYKVNIITGKKYKYIIDENKIYRCTKKFEKAQLKLLELYRDNYITELKLGKNELTDLFSVIIPRVKDAIKIENIPEDEIIVYTPKKLIVKMFLDFDENDYLVADIKFRYENNEFNPLDENQKIEFPRNVIKETKAMNMFRKSGFMLDTKKLRFILPDNDKIYRFLSNDITYYMQYFEVLVTDKFKNKQIREPKIGNIGVRSENNLLYVNLENLDIDMEELQDILTKYSLKKKYHRLKDGSFIDLKNNNEIKFLDKLVTGMDIDCKQLEQGEIKLPVYRSLYLEQLLKEIKSTQIIKNKEYITVVNELDKDKSESNMQVPENLRTILRYYQKTGFKWLKTLDNYKFGGILADDMGLGKTIQILSVILDYVQENKNKKASIVVCPSSLSLNWQNEANKFTNNLKTLVISGSLNERKDKIKSIDKYDLVITSYDLLKRDIELYEKKDYIFKFIIADEAQYLKNSNTQNAKSIKKIKADTRFALTGTPIENSLSELWSIFDFIMPGYLFSYRKFKNIYETPIMKSEDKETMQKLKMLIEPFILRRNKKDVLKELPDKTVTVLNNEMFDEQRNLYLNYLAQAKQEIAEKIKLNGYESNKMQILAALTRLRQICCHPSLFINDYKEGSSKLEQCMEILKEATKSGHKILLFSGYTSMFEIIEKELEKEDIKYFKLTGSTKIDERVKMVEEFNKSSEVQVFLISLKAGGTGLNLTGADMVIHYDPWWNLSTENQATDRAYRIGQKNNVQVYKLITKNTIEEKIYELQEKKYKLANNMLDTNTVFVNKLTKDDILKLFE